MTCMRARDYLHLVKWLDSRGCNTLKTFVLRYQLNIADTAKVMIRGKWNETTGEPEIDKIYENFLGFFVEKEIWGSTGEAFSEIVIYVNPIRYDYRNVKIPETLLCEATRGELWNWTKELLRVKNL